MLSNLSDDNVMQLEEPEVHKVQQHSVPCLDCSLDISYHSLAVSMHGATNGTELLN